MGRPRAHHTETSMYQAMRAFVLAEHRLPSLRDYEAQAHGLPHSSGTMYRYCKRFKELLAKDGIAYTERQRSAVPLAHPWHLGKQRTPPVFLED